MNLEALARASRDQQGHVKTQLQELEGCSAATSSQDGSSGAGGGGICVADLQRQLRAYAAQEQEANAQLNMLEQRHQTKLAALLLAPGAAAAVTAGASGERVRLVAAHGGGAAPQTQGQPRLAGGQQQQGGPLSPAAAGGWQQQEEQGGDRMQAGDDPRPEPLEQRELEAALLVEAARVETEVAQMAVQQQLEASVLEQRRHKKARTDSISQVWDWLQGGGGEGGGGGGGGGGGAGEGAAAAGEQEGGGGVQQRHSQGASVSTG